MSRRGFPMATAFADPVPKPSAFADADSPTAGLARTRKLTDADWRKKRLPPASYEVLRHEDTERPDPARSTTERGTARGPSSAWDAACRSSSRSGEFESGTGWPRKASTPPSRARSPRRWTSPSACRAPNTIAPNAWVTRGTCSRMVRSPRACATATTAWRSGSCRLDFRRRRRLWRRRWLQVGGSNSVSIHPSDGCCLSRRRCFPASPDE